MLFHVEVSFFLPSSPSLSLFGKCHFSSELTENGCACLPLLPLVHGIAHIPSSGMCVEALIYPAHLKAKGFSWKKLTSMIFRFHPKGFCSPGAGLVQPMLSPWYSLCWRISDGKPQIDVPHLGNHGFGLQQCLCNQVLQKSVSFSWCFRW